MAQAQSLAELKAENAAEEVETEVSPQEVEEETETEVAEVETEVTDEVAEPESEETEETEVEDWMQTDAAEKKFTDGDIGAAKKKLRAKLESKHNDELDKLRTENEQLRSRTPEPKQLNRPKREDFLNSDDQDEAYIDALTDYKMEKASAKQATTVKEGEATRQQNDFQQAVSQEVDQHYERAVKLSEDSGISPELYQSADLKVRQVIESIFPNAGDSTTDHLISNLGEGSEKVFYSLGVNSTKRDKFESLLRSDKTGLKAAIYLGELKSELTAPNKRRTNAPKPAAQIKGDASTTPTGNALKKKYDAAHKKGDVSGAFKLKRAAKKEGIKTSSW